MTLSSEQVEALVERLRIGVTWSDGKRIGAIVGEVNDPAMRKAADALTVLVRERDEAAEKLERRRNIYLAKRDKFNGLCDLEELFWDKYDFAAEVIEWMAGDLDVTLPERPEIPSTALNGGGEG